MDRQRELQRLSEADKHVVQAERAISGQAMEIEKLRRDGHNTALAEKTLKTFNDTLQVMRDHRAAIVNMIEQIDKGLI